ncbi:hypothetical protein ACFQ60_24815 [Streptomyces zhihengii]
MIPSDDTIAVVHLDLRSGAAEIDSPPSCGPRSPGSSAAPGCRSPTTRCSWWSTPRPDSPTTSGSTSC